MTVLCAADDLKEGQSLGFYLDNQAVFAVRKDGEVFVYKNECPHLGIELEFMEHDFLDMDGALIQCSTHGALFEIESGNCLAGPCQGDRLTPVPFAEEDGQLVLK